MRLAAFFLQSQEVPAEAPLLRDILKKVSRSFYLSLVILPPAVRTPVSLGYLFCRAADTLADTRLLPRAQRQQALSAFRHQFRRAIPSFATLEALQRHVLPHQGSPGERQLLAHLSDCFQVFLRLPASDRRRLRALVLTLTRGMEMDLHYFPGESVATAQALPDLATLDRYTYYVAGVVGKFWTAIHAAHLPALRTRDLPTLLRLSVRFGKGLQLTNILRDIGRDLHAGRCYLPLTHLVPLGLSVSALLQPDAGARLRPLLAGLIRLTLEHLDAACTYVLLLPWRLWRLRLSCMWPLLFAVQTLHRTWQTPDVLQPASVAKISRAAVYRTMGWSLLCLASPRLFRWSYCYLRRALTATLPQVPENAAVSLTHCGMA